MPKKRAAAFFSSFPQKTFSKGDILVLPKKPVSSIFYIESGLVRMYGISPKGNEITFTFFRKGAFIPIGLVMNKMESLYYHEAFTPLKVRVAPAQQTLQFLQSEPIVMYDLLQRVYRAMEAILQQREYLVEGNSQLKLVQAIISLAKRFGEVQKDQSTHIPMDLDEARMASIAGLARETVSRELQKLQKQSMISYNKKKLTVNNLPFLENFAQKIIDAS